MSYFENWGYFGFQNTMIANSMAPPRIAKGIHPGKFG
jgi:hypothetical protein